MKIQLKSFNLLLILFIMSFFSSLSFAQSSRDFIEAKAVPLPELNYLPRNLFAPFLPAPVILLGEIHGTQEGPLFFQGLARFLVQKYTVLIALEIDQKDQMAVDRYLQTGSLSYLALSPFFRRKDQDGRSSQAMVDLLSELRKLPNIKVLCMDPAGAASTSQERDTLMATFVQEKFAASGADKLLILAGNIHTSLDVGTPWEPQFRPMAHQLLKNNGGRFSETEVLPIRLRYYSGSAWMCLQGEDECKESALAPIVSPYSQAQVLDPYFLRELPYQGHKATFFVRTLSASAPFVKKNRAISPEERRELLLLSFAEFDQLAGEGWRKITDRGHFTEAAELIESYLLSPPYPLLPWQERVLYFHAGQNYAFDQHYHRAIPRFESSFNAEEDASSELAWNAYVGATLAFLKQDKPLLLSQRALLAAAFPSSGNQLNLKVVDRLIACFGQPYGEVYSGFCQ